MLVLNVACDVIPFLQKVYFRPRAPMCDVFQHPLSQNRLEEKFSLCTKIFPELRVSCPFQV